MLTEEEIEALEKSTKMVENFVAEVVSEQDNAVQTIQFMGELHSNVDRVAARAFTQTPKAACKAGCSHCCHNAHVEITTPEALYIATHLQALQKDELAELIEHLSKRVANTSDNKLPQPCTFLDNDHCLIYQFRPAVCRKAHSQSVEACKTNSREIPQDLGVIISSEALMTGTTRGYESLGLDAKATELNAALLAVLTNENFQAEWFSHKKLLAPNSSPETKNSPEPSNSPEKVT